MSRWKNLKKRLKAALGFGTAGAIGFNIIGWLIVGVESIAAGTWPSLVELVRMTGFTLSVGGTVGVLTAGAIALGAGASKSISRTRAFLAGLAAGAAGGLAMALGDGGLALSNILFVTGSVGLATGLLGAAAVQVATRRIGPGECAADSFPPTSTDPHGAIGSG